MKKPLALILALSLFVTTGCWDQVMLKDENLALAVGFDLTNKKELNTTIAIPYMKSGGGGQSPSIVTTVQILSMKTRTPRQARVKINNEIAESINATKMLSLGLGEKLAKTHIFPYLDLFYRDPRGSLNAYLYVAKGHAFDLLKVKNPSNPRIGIYLSKMLKSTNEATVTQKADIQSICADMMDPGADFELPYIEINKKDKVLSLKGVALFHGDTYTGAYLNTEQSTMLLLMKGLKEITARQTIQIADHNKMNVKNYVNIDVKNTHAHLKLKMDKNHRAKVNLLVNLGIKVEEYPHDQLFSDKQKNALNKKISKQLTLQSRQIIKILQKENCDAFAIGRRINAFHHADWIKMNKKHYFRDLTFNVTIKTKLLQQGVTY